jgi:hypothetical protein
MNTQQNHDLYEASLKHFATGYYDVGLRRRLLESSNANETEVDEFMGSRPLDSNQLAACNIPPLSKDLLELNIRSPIEKISRVRARLRLGIDQNLKGLQIDVSISIRALSRSLY